MIFLIFLNFQALMLSYFLHLMIYIPYQNILENYMTFTLYLIAHKAKYHLKAHQEYRI